ncbi:MAG: TetR/AcrR family transcriptional regulator [Clostridiales bacterium]|nr:TetR/AcrR family transcriptional regulator [Candidatus Blautia equi]
MDRRIKYTRMVLNDSLLHFLEEKDIAKITVKEICVNADVNRSTYYAHFSDPFDQLKKLKEELIHDVTEFTLQIDTTRIPDGQHQYQILKSLLRYVDEKRHIFRTLLNKTGDRSLQEELLQILGEKVFPADRSRTSSEDERKYRIIYATNGCFGMFYHWLMSENPISPDQLAQMMTDYTQTV